MADQIYPLQKIEFNDEGNKAQAYAEALKERYKNWDIGDSLGSGAGLGGIGVIAGLLVAIGVGGVPPSLLSIICILVLPFVGTWAVSSFLFERLRRKGVRSVLKNPEVRYAYALQQASEAYNKQAAVFNERLCEAGEMNFEDLRVMRNFRDFMDARGEYLRKKIGSIPKKPQKCLLDFDTDSVNRGVLAVCDAQARLTEANLPLAVLPDLAAHNESPQESPEYTESLAELDAEFSADKD